MTVQGQTGRVCKLQGSGGPSSLTGFRKQGLELEEVGAAGERGDSRGKTLEGREPQRLGRAPKDIACVLTCPQAKPQVLRRNLQEVAAEQILEQTLWTECVPVSRAGRP